MKDDNKPPTITTRDAREAATVLDSFPKGRAPLPALDRTGIKRVHSGERCGSHHGHREWAGIVTSSRTGIVRAAMR